MTNLKNLITIHNNFDEIACNKKNNDGNQRSSGTYSFSLGSSKAGSNSSKLLQPMPNLPKSRTYTFFVHRQYSY